MGLFEKGVGQRLDRLAERFGQPLGLGRVEVESRHLDGRCGDIRQLIAGMGLDVFDLVAVAGAVERHDDGGDAAVATRRTQAGLVPGITPGGYLYAFPPSLVVVAPVAGWVRPCRWPAAVSSNSG